MKAILKDDIIIRITERGTTEIGTLPKGIGLERLRFNGTQIVDLADLSSIWIENQGGVFILHAIEVEESQQVEMTYNDRKRLMNANDGIRLRTLEEMDAQEAKEIAFSEDMHSLKADLIAMVEDLTYAKINKHIDSTFATLTEGQRQSLKKLYKVVLFLAKKYKGV